MGYLRLYLDAPDRSAHGFGPWCKEVEDCFRAALLAERRLHYATSEFAPRGNIREADALNQELGNLESRYRAELDLFARVMHDNWMPVISPGCLRRKFTSM